jgi:hypothetical protein
VQVNCYFSPIRASVLNLLAVGSSTFTGLIISPPVLDYSGFSQTWPDKSLINCKFAQFISLLTMALSAPLTDKTMLILANYTAK